jgi:hypothetical protein
VPREMCVRSRGVPSFPHSSLLTFATTANITLTKMADEEHDGDYHIENADAGSSLTIPMEAGQVKKGG